MSKNLNQIYTANPITSNTSTDLMYFMQSPYGAGTDAGMTYANFSAQFGTPYTASALTRVNDTNVTLTLGGTPGTALLQATSLTLGWTGTLSGTRGGTGVNNGANTATFAGNLNFANSFTTSGNFAVTQTYTNTTNVTFPTSGTLATTSQIPTGSALTASNDTNVTLTLGGSPTTALINATSITAGWTGTLAVGRGGLGIATTPTNGQIPIGNGTNYTAATLTAGTNISVTNGSGSITIAATGTASFSWAANATSSISAAVNNGYILTSASPTTVTLPTTFAVGQIIGVMGQGAAFTVALGASTNIKAFGNTYTTSFASANNTDVLVLMGTVANTTWQILQMSSTGFTAS